MIIIFFYRAEGTDSTFILESLMRNLVSKVNDCVSLSVSKQLVLSSSLINMRKFSMQESRQSATKQNGGRVKRKIEGECQEEKQSRSINNQVKVQNSLASINDCDKRSKKVRPKAYATVRMKEGKDYEFFASTVPSEVSNLGQLSF